MNELNIDKLIKMLKLLKGKKVNSVQLKGTLMAEDYGNFIISSTEKQG